MLYHDFIKLVKKNKELKNMMEAMPKEYEKVKDNQEIGLHQQRPQHANHEEK